MAHIWDHRNKNSTNLKWKYTACVLWPQWSNSKISKYLETEQTLKLFIDQRRHLKGNLKENTVNGFFKIY